MHYIIEIAAFTFNFDAKSLRPTLAKYDCCGPARVFDRQID